MLRGLHRQHTALLIADFYADQMSKLPHAVNRKCVEKTLALRQAARAAGLLTCYQGIGGVASQITRGGSRGKVHPQPQGLGA